MKKKILNLIKLFRIPHSAFRIHSAFCILHSAFEQRSVVSGQWSVRKLSNYALCIMHSALILLSACGAKPMSAPVSETRLLLSTVCTVTLYDPQDEALLAQALDLCAEYEALFSMTIEGSDMWRINNAGGEPVEVSTLTAEVIRSGIFYGELSGGMFDITIGRLSALWDFSGETIVPDEEDILAALKTVDHKQVTVTGDTVRLVSPEAWLDPGGIAKGYIADLIASFLVENGVKSAIIDLGGNIVAVGERPDGNPWRVGVRQPFGEYGELFGVIETYAASVVTAGIYERSFKSGGELYHHILDPYTGLPVKTDIVSATIVTEGSMSGDALSTIILLVGSEAAATLLQQVPDFIGAVLIVENGDYILYGNVEFSTV